eukprot:CAMPEP_0177609420 /NCGR_PEP_ID=MMETSP0419_2-20121207/19077_1 /TAXON_ID=582737 /ORGANISM="Tetraselmis sp., Strain GSL018" /LENGTH=409 /DNA_ID=CAMNT_0019104339 /DNA_START=422 /DNA_END=1651 /DNA_ORIENTATION=+
MGVETYDGDLFPLQYLLPASCRLGASMYKFDSVRLSTTTDNPLAATAVAALRQVAIQLELPLEKIQKFGLEVEKRMLPISYHNRVHVVDVLQLMYLQTAPGGPIHDICRDPVVKLSAVLAAVVHDLAHPGYNNAFLVDADHEIAKKFGKNSTSETMHVALFKKLISNPELNFLETLGSESRARVLFYVEQIVLATDMSKHMEYINSPLPVNKEECILFKLAFAMKVADMSHNIRSFQMHNKFVDMLKEEFYEQGDKERELQMQITTGMDRDEAYADIGEFQVRFLSIFIGPLLERWHAHSQGSPLVKEMQQCLLRNMSMWSMLSVRNIRPLQNKKAFAEAAQRNPLNTGHLDARMPRRSTQCFARGYGMDTGKEEIARAVDIFRKGFASTSERKSIDRTRLTVPHGTWG